MKFVFISNAGAAMLQACEECQEQLLAFMLQIIQLLQSDMCNIVAIFLTVLLKLKQNTSLMFMQVIMLMLVQAELLIFMELYVVLYMFIHNKLPLFLLFILTLFMQPKFLF